MKPTGFIGSLSQTPLLRPFYPALDGLRALAFLAVFTFHSFRLVYTGRIWTWGWVGVDIFFALSGFLITGILFDTVHRPDYFKNFYMRRTLRIFPLFYGFWLALLILTPLIHAHWNRALVVMALYLGNFLVAGSALHRHADVNVVVYGPLSAHGAVKIILVNHFWSLCVEEQFYLVWPAVIWLVRSRQTLLRACLVLLGVLPLLRLLYLHLHPEMLPAGALYFNTFARLDGLLAGSVVALWLRQGVCASPSLRRNALVAAVAAPIALALCLWAEKGTLPLSMYDPVVSTIGYSLIAIAATGILLLAIQPQSWLVSALQFRPLVALGRISYGMYFFHELLLFPPGSNGVLTWFHSRLASVASLFFLTFVVSSLSFRFFESPFLRLKTRLAPRKGAINDPPADPSPVLLTPEGQEVA